MRMLLAVLVALVSISVAYGAPKDDAQKKKADRKAAATAAKEEAVKQKKRTDDMRKKALAAVKEKATDPKSVKVAESESLGLKIWKGTFGPDRGEYYAWRIKYRAKNNDGAMGESEWCVLFDGNLNVRGVVGYPSAGHLAEPGQEKEKGLEFVPEASQNEVQSKAITAIKEEADDPDSIENIEFEDLGRKGWWHEIGPPPGHYLMWRAKYRANNKLGAKQVFIDYVLIDDQLNVLALASQYPGCRIYSGDTPPLNKTLLDLAEPGGMRGKKKLPPKR